MRPDALSVETGHHSNEAVRCNAVIAAVQSRPGMPIPLELFQGLLQRAGGDPAVHLALSAGCTVSTEAALTLLDMIHPDGQPVGLECVVKMIMAIAVDEAFREYFRGHCICGLLVTAINLRSFFRRIASFTLFHPLPQTLFHHI
jgi:hypothetical protein